MTQEEKAKAYDQAIEKLRDFYRDYDTVSCLIDVKEELERMFPELKESEDEKIRKWLIDTIKQVPDDSIEWESISKVDVLAWLEKQGEQKPVISDDALREGIAHFGITQYQIDNWLKKYVGVEQQGEKSSVLSNSSNTGKENKRLASCDRQSNEDTGRGWAELTWRNWLNMEEEK